MFGGLRSEADDPEFFNAPTGKTDPRAELEATLRAFFSDRPETDKQQNPQCQFVARYRWLKARLQFDPSRLPEQPCPRFERWRNELDPQSVTLVFPAAYINSPASMYGHTLLRLDGRAQSDRTRILDYALNFAAHTGNDGGLSFAYKGLAGGYIGRFSLTPYYLKIAEYSDIESRDIWEYRLALAPHEIQRLLEHAWELGSTRFDYYFLDENCSYQLLWLLDVARPSLDLVEHYPAWVIPADTIRSVVSVPGLVADIRFRPSRSTQLLHFGRTLPPADVATARALADNRLQPDDPALARRPAAERARVLDLAFETLDFERLSGERRGDASASRLRELMLARATVDGPEPPQPPPPDTRPDEGHGSARLGIGGGTTAGNGFQEIRFRGAYHDLSDPVAGYSRGAQIEFGNLVARRENAEGLPFLEKATIVDVTSISARTPLSRSPSWRLNFGFERSRGPANSRPLLFQISGGAGIAFDVSPRLRWYALGELGAYASGHLEQRASVGAGDRTGVLFDWNDRWRVHAVAQGLRYLDGPSPSRSGAALVLDHSLTREWSLRVEADVRREFGTRWSTVGAFAHFFF
ncbi:MAG: DUF4105 domain-containing protein [Betaproteobacteria bacterium]|nr:DUF4105 domain-containing protein [Betaproteobacteria bacterium]